MRAKRYGANDKYRGRKKGSTVLKVLIGVLAVLLALGLVFILIMGKYIEYTDDGVKLVLPWLQNDPSEETRQPDVSDLLITEEPSPSPSPTPSQTPELIPLAAVEVTAEELTEGTAAEAAALAGGNALVVTVKDPEGRLAWQSRSELAQNARGADGTALNGSGDFSRAVRDLSRSGDLYLVARMNCFQDLWMCVHDKTMALTTRSGKLWYDSKGMPWLSPANEDARAYLDSLCLELAELGFDEILLDCAGFPDRGNQTAITAGDNNPEDRSAAVAQWLSALAEQLQEQGVCLSVTASEGELTGPDSVSGRTAAALAASADRVWLADGADRSACAGALAQAGAEDMDLVWIFRTVPEGHTGSWAVLQN